MFNNQTSNLEKKWLVRTTFVIMLTVSVPYLMAYSAQGADWRFTGFLFGVEDGNSYIAKMLLGSIGDWLFRTPYTVVPQRGVLAYLPYLVLGKLAGGEALHDQLVTLFHVYRFFAGGLMLLVTYDFIAIFLRDVKYRRVAFIVITLGGGLGWILVLLGKQDYFGSLPLDMISPEAFGFLSIYGLPHLCVARALLLLGLGIFVSPVSFGLGNKKFNKSKLIKNPGIIIGFLWFLLAFFQPMDVIIAWIVGGIYLSVLVVLYLFRRVEWGINEETISRKTFIFLYAIALSSPILIYNVFMFSTDPYLKQWVAQNILESPPPVHLLFAYGLLLPLEIYGIMQISKIR